MIITKRSSPNIQYSFTLNVYFANDDNSNNKKGRDQKDEDPTLQKMTRIHAIAEDYSNHHFLEYKSDFDQMLNELTTFEQLNNDTKCYSLTHSNSNKSSPWISHDDNDDDDAFGSMITISQWNQLVNSLQAYTPSQPLSSVVFYDQGVDELMRNNDLSPLVGQLQSNDENDETALVFVDNQSGLMVHVITERIHVQIMQISTGETQKVKDSVDRLNRQCTNLNDEIAALMQMNKKSNQQHRVNTMRRPTMKKAPPAAMDMWFLDNDRSCRLPFVRHDKNCATNQMKAAPEKQKVCVFLHGSGETAILPPSNIKERYWGNVHEFTPQCSERWFISMDTKNYGWDNYDLQRGYCHLAAFHNKTVPEGTPAIIKDTIVFSHSMGNLILAAGLKNGFCSMANSSSWYSVSSPYGGSVASPMLKELCYNYYYGKSPNLFRKIAGYIAQGGYCLVNTPNAYPSYLSLDPDYCSTQEPKQCIKDLEPVTQAYVTGASCGLSPYGLASRYSILLGALSTIVGYGQKNDGMVGKSSCEIYHANSFTNNVRNVFYSTGCNHADATCRNGNGWWGASRQPCSYYTDKV